MPDLNSFKSKFSPVEWERVMAVVKRVTANGYAVQTLERIDDEQFRLEAHASIVGAVKEGHTVGMIYRFK